ncbi:DUF3841 domain-containing protein [Metabacillus malikii]|uniref:DUF3841 domain-containing protein n=1 Tax=Metabacillus malikii TaxID=1504265 RepID=A0ABT9ZGJ9_9BACI|nr:DUF3841 domain-containing protein [Metabacillus malikii]MDQ0231374.1 hypothetical protein [Metabacillus malikii]
MGIYWTIQSVGKWQKVNKTGFLVGAREYIWPEFLDSYHWMMEQMKVKLPNYHGEYPVWVWEQRPDLRKSGHLEKGERGVLLKLELDDANVLLSDFQAWHFVIDNAYCNIEGMEDVEGISTEEIQASWQKIFDLTYVSQHPEWGEVTVQGVTGKVSIDKITLEKEFISR